MHFRVRRNVVQLVRTSYDEAGKKPRAVVVGRLPLNQPKLTDELRALLTAQEVAETESWISGQHRTMVLREELAATTLADTLAQANRWFARNAEQPAAIAAAASLLPELQALRRTLKSRGLLA